MITQTPWFERKFDLNFPVGLFPVIVVRLEGALPRVAAMTKGMDEKVLTRKPDNEWSVKEQVGHLYDLEELWYGRIDDFLSGQEVLRLPISEIQKPMKRITTERRLKNY